MVEIIFENTHFCAAYKPAGTLSVPARTGDKDTRPVAGKLLEAQLGRKIWPCHRIDEEVSGLLLFALNADAHRAANRWFETHEIRKVYQALTLAPDQGVEEGHLDIWKCRLMRGKKRAYEAPFGKESVTEVTLHNRTPDGRALWLLSPLTGRSHQLRLEMARHGHPIIGDSLYGSTQAFEVEGIALRAVLLDFSRCEGRAKFELPEYLSVPESKLFGPLPPV